MKSELLPAYLAGTLIMASLAGGHAGPIPVGFGQLEAGSGTNAITVFTYKPRSYSNGPLVIVFHGTLRNASEYCAYAAPLADRLNVIIAAPLFDTNRFPSGEYGMGGVMKAGVMQPRENWAFSRMPQIINAVREREGRSDLPYSFLGHSGGAQFTMRLAAIAPLNARQIVVANPGSHMFPRRDWDYGYGFGGLPPELSDDAALQRYLALPLTLCLGLADNDPNHPVLPRSAGAQLQGESRLERGRRCFEFAQNLARTQGWAFNWRKVEVPGVGHDGRAMFAAAEVQDALLEARKQFASTTSEAKAQVKGSP